MERDILQRIQSEVGYFNAWRRGRNLYSDARIVEVYFWSVINDRPVSWACVPANWPVSLRPRRLPSQSRMSRRLRTERVKALIDALEKRVLHSDRPAPLVAILDGKALPIAAHSHDRHAGWGHGVGGKQKGYKLHLFMGADETILSWRVASMNIDEREMARRMLRDAKHTGYILADALFDSNPLHELAIRHGGQLVAPRKYGSDKGLGHHPHSSGRLRSKDLLENRMTDFGTCLHQVRRTIERKFGYLTSTGGLLTHLPPWARTYHRVYRWVQSKLIISQLRTQIRNLRRVSHA